MTHPAEESASVTRLSPTSFEVMSRCRLRFSLGQHKPGASSGTPATRLGSICHSVLDACVRTGSLRQTDWKVQIQALWDLAVSEEETQAVSAGVAARARAWPGYELKRARLFQVASRLRDFLEELPPDTEVLTEQALTAEDGRLYGRADLIIRGHGFHRIIDYKSGAVTDSEGVPREAYVHQLQIYARLERAVSGSWPKTAHLFPLQGKPVEIDVHPDECLARGREALDLLAAYNAVVPGPQPASPSVENCRWCPHAPACGAFWSSADESWAPAVRAIRGVVLKASVTPVGGTTVEVDVSAGSLPKEHTVIKQIDHLAHHAVASIVVGGSIAAVGLFPDPQGAGYRMAPSGVMAAAER